MMNSNKVSKDWWKESALNIPNLITETPGPKSREMHANTAKHMRGLSSQVKLFPVCFEEGAGITLTDVDGNKYLDFSSGIYVTSLGHCHPKISEAIAYWAKKLMNAHDFTTPVKEKLCDKLGVLLFDDEVLAGMGRTGEWLCLSHWDVLPDIITLGKSFGNGFPVTAMVVKEEYADALDKISASSSYGGNPMACAAALASIEVIEEEDILNNVRTVGDKIMKRLEKMKADHPIIGDVKGKGFLLGIELVKDKATKEPFEEAGKLVYQKAFSKGLAWIPAGHILRMSPPLIMDEKYSMLGLEIIEDSIAEVEKRFGY